MAQRRRRGAPVKPGRQSTRRSNKRSSGKRHYPAHVSHQESAAKKQAKLDSLVHDRINYLRTSLTDTVQFRTRSAAERAIREAARDMGALYVLQHRTVKGRTEWRIALVRVDRNAVQRSSQMRDILDALKSRGKSAGGRKAKALEMLGRREAFWNWAVGETNE